MSKQEKALELNDDNFQQEVLEASGLVVVDLYSQTCAPCKLMAPIMDELAQDEAVAAKICKVDIAQAPKVTADYAVRSVPTFLYVKDGELLLRNSGGSTRKDFTETINALAGDDAKAKDKKIKAKHFAALLYSKVSAIGDEQVQELRAILEAFPEFTNEPISYMDKGRMPLSLVCMQKFPAAFEQVLRDHKAELKADDFSTDEQAIILFRRGCALPGDVEDLAALLKQEPELATKPLVAKQPELTSLALGRMFKLPMAAIELLIEAGAEPTVTDLAGLNRIDELKQALAENPACVNEKDVKGVSPLCAALFADRIEAAELLLAAGADKDELTAMQNMSPLSMSLSMFHHDFALKLVQAGASPAVEGDNFSMLHAFVLLKLSVEQVRPFVDAVEQAGTQLKTAMDDGTLMSEFARSKDLPELAEYFESLGA